jgi:hypothetical protein
MIKIRLVCRNQKDCKIILPEVPLKGDILIVDEKEYRIIKRIWSSTLKTRQKIKTYRYKEKTISLILEEK